MTDAVCAFCEIVAGRAEREVVLEDADVVAFLNLYPATTGHMLVAPRTHRRDIWEIEQHEAESAMAAAWRLARAVRDALGAEGLNLRQNSGVLSGQDVFHFHLHVLPRYENDTVLPGCVWGEPPWVPPPNDKAERFRVAEAIRGGLEGLKA
jgi:histidine triad (HIT) family protein